MISKSSKVCTIDRSGNRPGSSVRTSLLLFLLAGITSLLAAASPATPAAASADGGFDLIRFLGPFHIVVLHFPIGLCVMAAVMETWIWWTRQSSWRPALQLVLVGAMVAAFVTAPLGLAKAAGGGYSGDLLDQHRIGGILVAVFALLACVLHAKIVRHQDSTSGTGSGLGAFRFSLLICTGLVMFTGHTGGSMTHGTDFLTANAPAFLRPPQPSSVSVGTSTSTNTTGTALASQAHAILEKKCISCHGPEKKKGGVRLDTHPSLSIAGDSKSLPVKASDPAESEAIRRILLDRNHDEAMPPTGKEAVTEQELLVLIRWIQSGAGPW